MEYQLLIRKVVGVEPTEAGANLPNGLKNTLQFNEGDKIIAHHYTKRKGMDNEGLIPAVGYCTRVGRNVFLTLRTKHIDKIKKLLNERGYDFDCNQRSHAA